MRVAVRRGTNGMSSNPWMGPCVNHSPSLLGSARSAETRHPPQTRRQYRRDNGNDLLEPARPLCPLPQVLTPASRCPLADDRVPVQQVKEANDIVDVVGTYVALRPAGATFKGLCPFHNDQRPSFDVDPRRQRYRCWSCGKYGDVLQFVQEIERITFPEAMELLARRAGISLEKKGAAPHERGRALMLDVVKWAADHFHQCLLDSPLAEAARLYLGERKLTGETIRRFGLGYA